MNRATHIAWAPASWTWARLASLLVGLSLLLPVFAGLRTDQPDLSLKVDPGLLRAAAASPASVLSVIVRESDPASSLAERLVRGAGGSVSRQLPIVGGFAAAVPASSLGRVASSPAVARAWGDARIRVQSTDAAPVSTSNDVWRRQIRLPQANGRFTGAGVTVAILDTGIRDHPDLAGRIVATSDLTPAGDGIDTFGHGTHMAGIVAGDGSSSSSGFAGIAPRADVVAVRVAGANGATDVSVVIAGLQWIVAHRERFGIRVLNLSFGTDSRQPYSLDPLNYAVEQVWFSGILVVASAGNRGPDGGTINKPGDDPFVVTVGAANLGPTVARADDSVAPFSSRGPTQDGVAKPDLIAPGVSVVSLRAEGSTEDLEHVGARVGQRYVKASGTSQAAAVVAGVAALMYEADPTLTPDVAKAALVGTAERPLASLNGAGAGVVDAAGAVNAAASGAYRTSPANRGLVPSSGLGSLEASRGSHRLLVDMDGNGELEPLVGEIGFGWTAGSWSAGSWSAGSWSAGSWSAGSWSAGSWSAGSWSAGSWSAGSWSAGSWSAGSWSAGSWSARSWSAGSWSAGSWSAGAWS